MIEMKDPLMIDTKVPIRSVFQVFLDALYDLKKFGDVLNIHVCQQCRGNYERTATVSADYCQIYRGETLTEVP